MSETAWLIEIGGAGRPAYWDGRSPDTFTTDPNDVVRFARREDAERVLSWGVVKPPPGEVSIREHMWLDSLTPAPAAVPPSRPPARDQREPGGVRTSGAGA